ncbi:type I polyketide synthase [Geomonas subterranea]|uniref:Type I polyketide synthase n=1 Tax=Geomonas subterranea TaxID=2847989 RepID=A0ABX8LKY6_9BACT|nr:beta-ketoacyl synthase N-terminal-like domain-containing protein [Geomonas subterranea]QXE92021.1 type I polyketide synthase [Geomonas subterranea]QXM09886.1 type I polyketide synthase [Geomonas subterranea]
MKQQSPSVAIVGMGGIFPDAPELTTFWENIRNGKSAAREVPAGRWALPADAAFDPEAGKPDHVYSKRGCFIDAVPAPSGLSGLHIDPKLAEGLDPAFHLLLHAGKRAFDSAVTAKLDRSRVGVIIGNLALPSEKSAQLSRALLGRTFEEKLLGHAGTDPIPNPLNRYVAGLPAGFLAAALGLGGGCGTLDAACASSLYAIKLACDELISGRADAMLTGGLSRPDPLYTQMGFAQLRALSRRGICAPFDASGDGLVVGEGAGIFVLKRLEDAIAQGDRIYGVIKGIGLSNDVGGSLLAPMADGQLRAMRAAYAKAGWSPQDVDLIECHATGTPVGDATEVGSLRELWGDASGTGCVIGSVKSNIGHLLTAAGSAALTKVLLAMAEETLPPTANFTKAPENFHLEESPFRVLKGATRWQRRAEGVPRRAAVSAFGFGGINAHLLVEEWLPQGAAAAVAAPPKKGGPVAVVGLDARFGTWQDLKSFQSRVLGGDAGAKTSLPKDWWGAEKSAWFDKEKLKETPFAGYYLDQFAQPTDQFRIPPKELEEMLPQQLLMLQSAAAAMKDAGADRGDNLRAGVFVGIALDLNSTNFAFRWTITEKAEAWARQLGLQLSPEELEQWIAQLRDHAGPPLTANRTMGALGSVVASRVAREFRCGGPSFTMSSEESSGLRALETAVRQLQSDEIDRAIVGAVDLAGDLRAAIGQHLNRPYSGFGSVTPFDQSADGTVIGEGAATVILKRLEDAERDGDRIYAVIGGIGSASGDVMLPGVPAYRHALERAYGEAEVAPASIGLLEAHGSGNAAEDRMEAAALTEFFDEPGPTAHPRRVAVASVKGDIGHTGAASGLASLVRGCLALYQEIIPGARTGERPVAQLSGNGALFLPAGSRYWLRNRSEGARQAGVSVFGVDGSVSHVVLQGYDKVSGRASVEQVAPLGGWDEFLFCITGTNRQELAEGVQQLRETAERKPAPEMALLSRRVCKESSASGAPLAVSLVARSADELASLCLQGERILRSDAAYAEAVLHPSQRDRLFFNAKPIGKSGKIGFVYPGSGNHFAGMGMELSARWPEVYRRQDAENLYLREQFQPEHFWNGAPIDSVHENHLAVIFGQVATGCAVTDVVQRFGINPSAVISYSLGESAGLFATRTWTERDLMLTRMKASTLFTRDLAGECRAAREAWGEPEGKEINWSIGVVDAPAREVRRALKKTSRVYLLIVNTPDECVIGGDVKWVKHLVAMLDCRFFPLQGVTTVHCEVARQVANAYRDLHVFNTTPPAGVTFYSGAAGSAYQVNRRSAAESILAQAVEGIDYPKVIEAAYDEGIRYFIEMGPGASCSRMIGRILNNRPHVARSVCQPGTDANSAVLRLLAQLTAERVPVDLEPLFHAAPELVQPSVIVSEPKGLRFTTGGAPFAPGLPTDRQEPSAPAAAVAAGAPAAPVQPAAAAVRPVQPAAAPGVAPVIRSAGIPVSTPEKNAAAKEDMAQFNSAPPAFMAPKANTAETVVAPSQAPPAPGAIVHVPAPEAAVQPLLREFAQAQQARQQAHDTYLRVANDLSRSIADALALQISIQQQMLAAGVPVEQDVLGGAAATCAAAMSAPAPAAMTTPVEAPVPAAPYPGALPALYDYDMCLEFAIGSVAKMLGPAFAEADTYPTRVRLPDVPLQLVHRIVALEGEPKSMTSGRVVTQHDVHPGAWYLDGGRIPTCIAVEAGQADLFLSGYLGIDFITKGLAVYRLLDAVVTFHRELPAPGETINYDIRIERFFRQGETYLFRFHFEATVNGEPLLSMRNGCAGFFSQEELDAGKGIVRGAIDLRPRTGKLPADWKYLVPMQPASYDARHLGALRRGDLAGCFGPLFSGLEVQRPLTIPGGRMELVHRVMELVPDGGRCGLGFIRAEADIHPDDWFITCHFVDDRVMPGTLMYECCMHTLRIFLLRLGWVAESNAAAWQPVPGVASQLCCRGQVLETTKVVTYEVTVRELGYRPEPYAIVDALMYADGKPIVEITNMSARLTGTTREALLQLWRHNTPEPNNFIPAPAPVPAYDQKPALYTKKQILAYSNGNPSEGFGELYKVFDSERKIARLPGPPFQFMDRVTGLRGEPWQMVPGAMAEAQYDIPVDEWYFAADRQPRMPFAVLLEAALQPCGWLAAYVGSALTSPTDISFRNLGGTAVQHRPVTPQSGTLTATATLTKAATSGGMIIQEFDFSVADRHGVLYEGETMFGFFAKEALANQVGIREAVPYIPSAEEAGRGRSLPYPEQHPFPDKMLRMIDRIDLYVADGGPAGLGYLRGTKTVVAEDWYFKAHFYQDPVTPGSLGLESFLQLMKFAAVERWGWSEGDTVAAVALERKHRWLYRGQVVPANKEVTVVAWVTAVDDTNRILTAAGFLYVDGRAIYQMNDFTVQVERG